MKRSKIALFDLDGTLADYDGQLLKDLQRIASEHEPPPVLYEDIPYIEARRHVITSQVGWFLNLPKFKLGWDVLEVVKEIGYSISILTKGPAHKHTAWSEKVEWCNRHLADYIDGVTLIAARTHTTNNRLRSQSRMTKVGTRHEPVKPVMEYPKRPDLLNQNEIAVAVTGVDSCKMIGPGAFQMEKKEDVIPFLEMFPNGLTSMPSAAHFFQDWAESSVGKGFSHPNVVRYDGTNLDEVRQRMITRFNAPVGS